MSSNINTRPSSFILRQGMEKDVIILTTAITRQTTFAADAQRLNVALTRARHHLVLIGCAPILQVGPHFKCCLCFLLCILLALFACESICIVYEARISLCVCAGSVAGLCRCHSGMQDL